MLVCWAKNDQFNKVFRQFVDAFFENWFKIIIALSSSEMEKSSLIVSAKCQIKLSLASLLILSKLFLETSLKTNPSKYR